MTSSKPKALFHEQWLKNREKEHLHLINYFNYESAIKIANKFSVDELIYSSFLDSSVQVTPLSEVVSEFLNNIFHVGNECLQFNNNNNREKEAQRCRPPISHLCPDSNFLLYTIAPLAAMW